MDRALLVLLQERYEKREEEWNLDARDGAPHDFFRLPHSNLRTGFLAFELDPYPLHHVLLMATLLCDSYYPPLPGKGRDTLIKCPDN